ncbi:MAG: YwqI/YxiC family protein, partial [Desulfobulbus sp.]|nr:YwqI/YxiC family protein [Desulfobulbus sp.]
MAIARSRWREVQDLHRSGRSQHVSVRARTADLEGLTQGHEGLAPQRAANEINERLGQMRQAAQGLVLDLAVFTAAAPEQMGMADLALAGTLGGDDVCGSFS